MMNDVNRVGPIGKCADGSAGTPALEAGCGSESNFVSLTRHRYPFIAR